MSMLYDAFYDPDNPERAFNQMRQPVLQMDLNKIGINDIQDKYLSGERALIVSVLMAALLDLRQCRVTNAYDCGHWPMQISSPLHAYWWIFIADSPGEVFSFSEICASLNLGVGTMRTKIYTEYKRQVLAMFDYHGVWNHFPTQKHRFLDIGITKDEFHPRWGYSWQDTAKRFAESQTGKLFETISKQRISKSEERVYTGVKTRKKTPPKETKVNQPTYRKFKLRA